MKLKLLRVCYSFISLALRLPELSHPMESVASGGAAERARRSRAE